MVGNVARTRLVIAVVIAMTMAGDALGETIRVGVVQTFIENTLAQNQAKLLRFIDDAQEAGCQLVIFPENALYWPEVSVEKPTKDYLDAAIAAIGVRAKTNRLYVVFGTAYKTTETGRYHNFGVVFDPSGSKLVFYRKNHDVPQSFEVDGVPCNLSVCSDRGYLEYSDLPALVQGSQIIIDTSGGHGGDDGGPELPLIRYRPWAMRTGAHVIVSNPVHDGADFMGRRPWGGGSAIIRPDGAIQNGYTYEKDQMLVDEINTDLATKFEKEKRRRHPLLRSFWDAGESLLDNGHIDPVPKVSPYVSKVRDMTIAAAQIACSRDLDRNTQRILEEVAAAAQQGADVIVFPELAVTGARGEDILAASQSALEDALAQIKNEAKVRGVYAVVGMPYFVDGARRNCAVVIGDDGEVKTKYAQIVANGDELFRAGTSTKAMWFKLKGVHSIVTIGNDAAWVEFPNLAASRGMYLHFHISYVADTSTEAAQLRKQRNLLALQYAKYGAVVNAAEPSGLARPSSRASGMSMIVSREGGHNKPSPDGLEYYLPYQTSVVKSAKNAEAMLLATRRTERTNDLDLDRYWRHGHRKNRTQLGWYDWIQQGALLMDQDLFDQEFSP